MSPGVLISAAWSPCGLCRPYGRMMISRSYRGSPPPDQALPATRSARFVRGRCRTVEPGNENFTRDCHRFAQCLDALDLMQSHGGEIAGCAIWARRHRDGLDDEQVGPLAEASRYVASRYATFTTGVAPIVNRRRRWSRTFHTGDCIGAETQNRNLDGLCRIRSLVSPESPLRGLIRGLYRRVKAPDLRARRALVRGNA